MAVSNASKQYLAVCERAKHAICVVHDLANPTRKPKMLTSTEYTASEFIDVKFAHSAERQQNFLLTMTGEPDYLLIIWLWDK